MEIRLHNNCAEGWLFDRVNGVFKLKTCVWRIADFRHKSAIRHTDGPSSATRIRADRQFIASESAEPRTKCVSSFGLSAPGSPAGAKPGSPADANFRDERGRRADTRVRSQKGLRTLGAHRVGETIDTEPGASAQIREQIIYPTRIRSPTSMRQLGHFSFRQRSARKSILSRVP